jgi:hypothetical protein
MKHVTTVTTATRQLGRTRVTDHKWSCSCGDFGKATNGFRTDHEARINALAHQPQNQWS